MKTGWTRVAFGDVVKLSRERSSNPEEDGFERYVGLDHIEPGDLKIRRWGDIADGTTFTSVFRPGQVLFGKRRAYQRKVALADFSGVCSGDIYVFEPKSSQLLPELLPTICQTDGFFEHAVGTSAGSLSPRTNWDSLVTYEFALPPLDEQRRISTLLLTVDQSISCLRGLSTTVESTIASTLEWALGRREGKHWASAWLTNAPREGVDLATLEECCDLITDGEHQTPQRTQHGVPLLSARNVLNRRLDLTDVDFVSPATFENLARRVRPNEGDLLISCSGTIGRVCEVPPGLNFAMVRSVAIVRPNPTRLHHRFLASFLRSRLGQQQIQSLVGQTAQGNLFQGAIRRIRIPVIPVGQQAEIADAIEMQANSLKLVSARLDATRSLRRELLGMSMGVEA